MNLQEFRVQWEDAGLRWVRTRIRMRLQAPYWRRRFGRFGVGSAVLGRVLVRRGELVSVGNRVTIHAGCRLEAVRQPGARASDPILLIGDGAHLERDVHLAAAAHLEIGAGTVLATGVYVTDHDHGRPADGESILSAPLVVRPTIIGRGVWVGERAIVLKGVTIGDGAVIGAGAVVTKSLPAGATAVGVPAREVRT